MSVVWRILIIVLNEKNNLICKIYVTKFNATGKSELILKSITVISFLIKKGEMQILPKKDVFAESNYL